MIPSNWHWAFAFPVKILILFRLYVFPFHSWILLPMQFFSLQGTLNSSFLLHLNVNQLGPRSQLEDFFSSTTSSTLNHMLKNFVFNNIISPYMSSKIFVLNNIIHTHTPPPLLPPKSTWKVLCSIKALGLVATLHQD